jgi:FMN phosphatase YigB (HAD superfamily)
LSTTDWCPRTPPPGDDTYLRSPIVTLSAILVDVGGTLWPDAWPVDQVARAARVEAVLPGASAVLPQLAELLEHRADADKAVLDVLTAHGLAVDKATPVLVRKAICSPFRRLGEPVPGAHELLLARGHRAGVDLFRS